MAYSKREDYKVQKFYKVQSDTIQNEIKRETKMSSLFVLGNGESRKNISIDNLKSHGKVYGCNAIYRDHTVDGLISVDPGIIHEIYHSGYAFKNKCYFRGWTPVPEMHLDMMIESMKSQTKGDAPIKENEKNNSTEFVIHMSDVNKSKAAKVGNDLKRWKGFGTKLISISWVKDYDKVTCLTDYFGDDPGWSAGATALSIGIKEEKPKQVYMIGMDFHSKTQYLNNIYKDTDHYLSSENPAIKPDNWIIQFSKVFGYHPNVEFIWVHEGHVFPEWKKHKNIKIISHEDLTF